MKQYKQHAAILLVALAVVLTTATAPAVAQQDGSGTATPENSTNTPSESDGEDTDDGIVESLTDDDNSDVTNDVVGEAGPGIIIHKTEYKRIDGGGEMWITLTVKDPGGTTIAYRDVFSSIGTRGVQPGVTSGQTQKVELDQGTHRLRIPAKTFEGWASVTISGPRGYADIVKQPGGGVLVNGPFDQSEFWTGALLSVLMGVTGFVALILRRRKNKKREVVVE